jgi:hypothetical protein
MFENWPHMHNPEVKKCVETLSLRSWTNIAFDGSLRLTAAAVSMLAVFAAYV